MTTKKIKEDPEKSGMNEVRELHDFVVEFRKYKTELNKKFLMRKPWIPKDDSKILSFIPGTITNIYVKEGDHVEAGQELMVLEAMKMKNKVFAEFSGIIKKICVTSGEKVPKAKIVFEMELD